MSLIIENHQGDLHTAIRSKARDNINDVNRQQRLASAAKTVADSKRSKTPQIPSPQIFRFLETHFDGVRSPKAESPESSSSKAREYPGHSEAETALPTISECAVHLELLLCFSTLHQRVEQSRALDRAFTIFPRPKTVQRRSGPHKLKDATFDTRRQKKWPAFLNMAVERFLIWVQAIDAKIAASSSDVWMKHFPPPLDVLMVWHSLLLNPSYYVQFCNTNRLSHIDKIKFPWKGIHESINSETYTFDSSTFASQLFEGMTSMDADLFESICKHSHSEVIALKLARLIEQTILSDEVTKSDNVTTREILPGGKGFLKFFDHKGKQPKALTKPLADAVTRQFAFCQKMELQLWIRSPALIGTLTRACIRYDRFLQLFKLYPNTMLVPTLDIDLVWHTHQLSPRRYAAATKVRAGRFIDHDDKLGKPTLDDGMARTENLYRVRFGDKYAICNCWECEALASAMEEAENDPNFDVDSLVMTVSTDVENYRLAEAARRNRKPAPA